MARAKAGQSVRGYKLSKDFRMAGGGNCEWAFATKDGREYFLKVFLNPKYPRAEDPGSSETKEIKRKECEEFERHQRELNEAVKRVAGSEGRLVAASDFFREENLFYKAAIKVPSTAVALSTLAKLPLAQRIRLLQNVTTAVNSLHNQDIVHGDLKIDNALLEKGVGDNPYIARLIDFDSSYFSGSPYKVEEMVGDPPYYSPELLSYIQKSDTNPTKLTTKSDVFALGLIFHQYLCAEMPPFPSKYQYACEAVRDGHIFTSRNIRDVGHEGLSELITLMLRLSPSERPSAFQIQNTLRDIKSGRTSVTITSPPDVPGPTDKETISIPSGRKGGSKLKGSLTRLKDSLKSSDAVEAEAARSVPVPEVEVTVVKPTKGKLKISATRRDSREESRTAEESSVSDKPEIMIEPHSAAPISDDSPSSSLDSALGDLVVSISKLRAAVEISVVSSEAPPRVKGSLRHTSRTINDDQRVALSDIVQRLMDLERAVGELTLWLDTTR